MENETRFSTPEEEIKYLEGRIADKKREIGDVPARDVVSEVIREHTESAPLPIASPLEKTPINPVQDELARSVSFLVDEAMSKGVLDAIVRARQTHNPYIIDAFHDALVERFIAEDTKSD